jgi:hypothetical protein
MEAPCRPLLPLRRLRETLNYDPATGLFTWAIRASTRIRPGGAAGGISPKGYIIIRIDGLRYRAHRLAWLYTSGDDPGAQQIDHVNGKRSDNRIANLRLANLSQQMHNKGIHSNNTSGVRGVTWYKRDRKWQASIMLESQLVYLGRFDTLEEAKAVRLAAEHKMHGEFSASLSRPGA